jgi:hypothetical protein
MTGRSTGNKFLAKGKMKIIYQLIEHLGLSDELTS